MELSLQPPVPLPVPSPRGAPYEGLPARWVHGERMRVLVVSESFLPQVNGVTNSVRRVLEHLAAQGHTAELVAPTGPETYEGFRVRRVRGANLPFYPDFRIGLETRRRLRREIARFRPDVVHVASPAALGHQAVLAAAQLGVPSVAIYQTDLVGFAERYAPAGATAALVALTRRIHSRADRTLAPSSSSVDQLTGWGVDRVHLWPRGVDGVLFHPTRRSDGLRARLAPDGELLVGYVGRLAPEKELELLTHVAAVPGVRLVLVGGGPVQERLRALLPEATFLGVLHGEELAEACASLDVFVHTGRHETFCQSVQEAMASGLPVVAPNAGGPVDLVVEGETGFLVEPGDGAAFAERVARLAADPALRRRMGTAARERTEPRTWHAVNERLVGHYREVAAARPRVRWSPQLPEPVRLHPAAAALPDAPGADERHRWAG